MHPINKPLIFDCPLLINTSYQYQCGSQIFDIRYYGKFTIKWKLCLNIYIYVLDKPSSIQAKIHYTKSNEIGLKILYPLEIIENLIISYKIKNSSAVRQLNISPPLSNVRLTDLSCGNIYEIMIYTTNQVGFSVTEYLIAKTDGSGRILIFSLKNFHKFQNFSSLVI